MPDPTFVNDRTVLTDDMLGLLRRIQKRLLVLTAAGAVLGTGIGVLVSGREGAIGALLAAVLGLFFTATTILLLRVVAGRGPELLQVVLLGGWILKMVVVVIVLLWLRQQDFYDRYVFFGVLFVLVVGAVVVEVHAVATARLPYVEPSRTVPGADAASAPPVAGTPSPVPPAEVAGDPAAAEGVGPDGGAADASVPPDADTLATPSEPER